MKVTLEHVANMAMDDPEFWERLRAAGGPGRALRQYGLSLDPGSRRRLAAILSLDGQTGTVDLDAAMDLARATRPGGGLTWVGMWPRLWTGPSTARSARRKTARPGGSRPAAPRSRARGKGKR